MTIDNSVVTVILALVGLVKEILPYLVRQGKKRVKRTKERYAKL